MLTPYTLDFSKAFDFNNHFILISKLSQLFLPYKLINIIIQFIMDIDNFLTRSNTNGLTLNPLIPVVIGQKNTKSVLMVSDPVEMLCMKADYLYFSFIFHITTSHLLDFLVYLRQRIATNIYF